jgi:hypothetical protein
MPRPPPKLHTPLARELYPLFVRRRITYPALAVRVGGCSVNTARRWITGLHEPKAGALGRLLRSLDATHDEHTRIVALVTDGGAS